VTDRPSSKILDEVAAYYTSKLQQHGTSSRGVDWSTPASHRLRHRQFLRLIEGAPEASVLDLGCGFGDFLRFLRTEGHRGRYIGYDVARSMIGEALRLYGRGPDRDWHVGSEPTEQADFAVASGLFNVKGNTSTQAWSAYIDETLDVLARTSRQGFAFNVLSLCSDVERRQPHLYYADPTEILNNCIERFGRSVALLQDYGLWEFTVIVKAHRT